MKTIIKLVSVIAIVAFCNNVSAQNQKLAHISFNELIVSMSEYDSAMVKLQKHTQELELTMEEMQVEWNKKLEDFNKNQANWTDLVKQSKNDDLMTLRQRIETFQQNAQESTQQEYDKLMQPVIEKANKAIEAVAKEQGITYVISDNSQILHFKAVGTIDLLPSVKKHLGINK